MVLVVQRDIQRAVEELTLARSLTAVHFISPVQQPGHTQEQRVSVHAQTHTHTAK